MHSSHGACADRDRGPVRQRILEFATRVSEIEAPLEAVPGREDANGWRPGPEDPQALHKGEER